MVAGYHLIWVAYGWWLPNDPRGSNSREIRVAKIEPLGELHYGRKRIQPASAELRLFYAHARDRLKHPLLTFDEEDIALIAKIIARVIGERSYTCYACAVMPEHVHLVIRRHRDKAEQMIEHFQQATRQGLIAAGKRAATHPVWGGPGWKDFLNTRRDFERVIEYVRMNPIKIGRKEQRWPFVKVYDSWMPAYRG
jgi:REP element-mobilizing transposase RayT